MENFRIRPDTQGMTTPQKIWAWRGTPLLAPIWAYKRFISPVLPSVCRHYPSCSEYCFQAIRQRGIVQGSLIGTWRLLRCAPWGTSGYDPVEAFEWPWQRSRDRKEAAGDATSDAAEPDPPPEADKAAPLQSRLRQGASESAPMPSSRIT